MMNGRSSRKIAALVVGAFAAVGCADALKTGVSVNDAAADLAADASSAPVIEPVDAGADAAPPRAAPDGRVSYPATTALFAVLDDMESESHFGVSPQVPALIHWYASWDRFNPMVPPPLWRLDPPRGASTVGLHARGMNLPGGYDIFVDFHPTTQPLGNLVDWSGYAGLAFWARSASGNDLITVAVVDDLAYEGAPFREQMYQAAAAGRTWHTRRVLTSREWERHVILFEDLRQEGAEPSRPLRANAINAIHFVLGAGGGAFETYLDDVTLLCRGACAAR